MEKFEIGHFDRKSSDNFFSRLNGGLKFDTIGHWAPKIEPWKLSKQGFPGFHLKTVGPAAKFFHTISSGPESNRNSDPFFTFIEIRSTVS